MAMRDLTDWPDRPHPCDGYRVERWRSPAGEPLTVALWLGQMHQGQWKNEPLLLRSLTLPSVQQLGALRRLEFLARALVRYFNTGGTWEELRELLQRLSLVVTSGLCPAGYYYSNSERVFDEDEYQHRFRDLNDPERVILWAEDWFWAKCYADPTVPSDDYFEIQPASHSAPLPTRLD